MRLAVLFIFTGPEQTKLAVYLVELLAALRASSRFTGSSGLASGRIWFAVLIRERCPAVRIAGTSPEVSFGAFATEHGLAAVRTSRQVTVRLELKVLGFIDEVDDAANLVVAEDIEAQSAFGHFIQFGFPTGREVRIRDGIRQERDGKASLLGRDHLALFQGDKTSLLESFDDAGTCRFGADALAGLEFCGQVLVLDVLGNFLHGL